MSRHSTPPPLTPRQQDVLFVIGRHEPVTASDVARHLLSTTAAERGRIRRLEERSLVARQYTGLGAGEHVGFLLTDAGREVVDEMDADDLSEIAQESR